MGTNWCVVFKGDDESTLDVAQRAVAARQKADDRSTVVELEHAFVVEYRPSC